MRISDWSSDVCSSDLVQLQQVLLNLIVNACEAMRETPPAERVLSVSSREGRGREVEILVADRSPGIAREIADQIFDPFAPTKKEGPGLGLPLSSTTLQPHTGHIRLGVRSDGGATLCTRLPHEGSPRPPEQKPA